MNEIDNLINICSAKKENGENIESILQFLRHNNCTKSTSIVILLKMKYLPAEKAHFTKHLVHFSETWKDFRESDENFHDKVIKFTDKEL